MGMVGDGGNIARGVKQYIAVMLLKVAYQGDASRQNLILVSVFPV